MNHVDSRETEAAQATSEQLANYHRRVIDTLRDSCATTEQKREAARMICGGRRFTDGTIAAVLTDAKVADEQMKLAIKADLEALRFNLGYDRASAAERLLIDLVVLCHLRVYCVEMWYSHAMAKDVTTASGLYWEKKVSAAQSRYVRAVEALARVRKLLSPTLQVNIAASGGQQVISNA